MSPLAVQPENVRMKQAQRGNLTRIIACGLMLLAIVSARAEERLSSIGASLSSSTISGFVDSTVTVRSEWASSDPAAASEWISLFPTRDHPSPTFDFTDRFGAVDVHGAVSVVPEPSSLALLLVGAAVSLVLVQRQKRLARSR